MNSSSITTEKSSFCSPLQIKVSVLIYAFSNRLWTTLQFQMIQKDENLKNVFSSFQIYHVTAANDDGTINEFSPQVSATCKSSVMNIKVSFNNSYTGAIHARDFRNSQCMQFGDGSNTVTLSLNLLAREGQADYCGILVHNVSGDVRK